MISADIVTNREKHCQRNNSKPAVTIMADIDDFFAKKDKKKKGTKKFSKANTDVIAKNLEESAIKEQLQQDKDMTNLGDDVATDNVNNQVIVITFL